MPRSKFPAPQTFRVATWNINSVRARIEHVERFLKTWSPDVLCLQETKVSNHEFPAGNFRKIGYANHATNGQRMHHGVAIVARTAISGQSSEDWQANGEARHVGVTLGAAGVPQLRLENVYVPAGGEEPDIATNEKFVQKLAFLDRMTMWAKAITKPTILVGDLNIAPLPEDVWSHKALINVVSHSAVEIEKLAALQAAHNFLDVGRHFTPAPERLYTWWSYRATNWRESDKGRRLDHIWISPSLAKNMISSQVIEDARSWDKPSDHAPVIVDFKF